MGSLRDQYPYEYTGDLSGECEIPLAVLKEFYMGEDTEEEEDQELCHIALVACTRSNNQKGSCTKGNETKEKR